MWKRGDADDRANNLSTDMPSVNTVCDHLVFPASEELINSESGCKARTYREGEKRNNYTQNQKGSYFFCPREEHSRKPEQVVSYLERVSPAPRLEMFARGPRPGWDVWGNQTDKYELPLLSHGGI